jgi:hypothetical protein
VLARPHARALGKLHRDLKPSNVLVTAEGRVVVLDFGLAINTEAGGVGQTIADDNLSGTPAYMAPEQAAGEAARAASDFYAVGVMLFEALTGRLPFEGSAHEILVDKRRAVAPRARGLVPEMSPDLDEICVRLWSRDPSARPDLAALRALFPPASQAAKSSRPSGSSGSGSCYAPEATPELLGRERELAGLREAFEATLGDQAVMVFVSGASGMGKSALCEAFLHELRAQGRATVLAGRCFERENVPFKGFDSLVDDLSRHLRRLSHAQGAALLPREVYALARLFPVLGRVEAVAEAPHKHIADPLELRRRASAAFGELLTRMRDRTPLCLCLDDVQWLDADAVTFLRALIVQPEPVPLLLLLSHRSEAAENNAALVRVREAIESNRRLQLRTLSVEPLSQQAAREVAARLLPEGVADAGVACASVARESGGSPFFVGELCRFVARHGADAAALGRLSLHDALGDHLNAIPPAAGRLLEHASLAGRPLPAAVLMQAAQTTHNELDLLRAARLVRLSSIDGDRVVECYHDKVREAVAVTLSELKRISCYASLAGALEARSHPDAELVATCLEGAGRPAAAAEHFARAADQAMAGTAFVHAAALYEKALALGAFSPERQNALTVAQGDALSEAGRAKEAAGLFLRAAAGAQGAESRDLRRRAAEGLVTTGHSAEGMALYRELFAEVGLNLPSSSGAALRHVLFAQLRLRLRGLDYERHAPDACPRQVNEVLELYRSAHRGVNLCAPLIGVGLDTDYLLCALRAGAAEHIACGLAYDAHSLSLTEPAAEARLTRMVDLALGISRELNEPRLVAEVEYKAGLVCGSRGLWKKSREHLERASRILRDNQRDVQAVLDNLQSFQDLAAFAAGEWLELASTTPGSIEQAYSRDRIWLGVMSSGLTGSVAWLSGDDVAGYQRVLEQAKLRWRPSAEPEYPDLVLPMGVLALHLYRAEPDQALAAIEPRWSELSGSVVGGAKIALVFLLHLRAMAALAKLRSSGDRACQAIVRDASKRLLRLGLAFGAPMRAALEAGLALGAGQPELAAKQLRAAVEGFEQNDMTLHGAAARRRLGQLVGGDEGQALLAAGDAALRAQRVKNLEAMTEMLCAGCGSAS